AYVLDEAAKPSVLRDAIVEAREFMQAKNLGAALRILDGIEPSSLEPKDRLLHGELCARFGRKDQALAILETVAEDEGGWRRKVLQARILVEFGEFQKAIDLIHPLARGATRRVAYQVWVDALRTGKKFDDAIVILQQWVSADRSLHALRALAEVLRAQGKTEAANAAYRAALEKPSPQTVVVFPEYQATMLDYAEYLIEQKAFAEARGVLGLIGPESKANVERLATLRLLTA